VRPAYPSDGTRTSAVGRVAAAGPPSHTHMQSCAAALQERPAIPKTICGEAAGAPRAAVAVPSWSMYRTTLLRAFKYRIPQRCKRRMNVAHPERLQRCRRDRRPARRPPARRTAPRARPAIGAPPLHRISKQAPRQGAPRVECAFRLAGSGGGPASVHSPGRGSRLGQ